MYDLERFTLKDVTECGTALRKLGDGCLSLEEVAQKTVEHLYQNFGAAEKSKACALVRFYVTQPYSQLDSNLQKLLEADLDVTLLNETTCLILLGSAGLKKEWTKRDLSKHHRAVALPSNNLQTDYPVVAQMITRFGLPAGKVRDNSELFVERKQQNYNVLYISDAATAPAVVPDQEGFVTENGIKSVIGFGGLLPSGSLFAVVVFALVSVSKQTALAFRPFALNTKLALLPFDSGYPVFSSQVNAHGRR